MSLKSQKALIWTRDLLSLLVVASVFAAAYFIRSEPSQNDTSVTLLIYVVNFVVVIGLAWFSFYHQVNLKVLFVMLLVIVIVRYSLPGFEHDATSLPTSFLTGIMYGLAVSTMAGVLAHSQATHLRPIIFLGVSAAALILPLIHTWTDLGDSSIQRLLFFIAAGATALFLVLDPRSTQPFAPAKEMIDKYRGTPQQWVKVLFTQRRSTLLTLVMMIPFFFCLGIFDSYSFEKGFSFATSDVIMLGTAGVLIVLCITDRIRPTTSWLGMICFVVGAVYMTIIFSTLIVVDFPPYLFGIMRAGIVIMQVQVLIFLSETVFEESLSPTFLYGALAFIVILPNMAGNAVALLLGGLESSILVGGALMAIAIVAGALVVLLIKGVGAVGDERESTDNPEVAQDSQVQSQASQSFIAFCDKHGLSEKETEVIRLYSQGRNVRFITSKLYISESTARTYIQRVYAKLDVHNKQELINLIDDNG